MTKYLTRHQSTLKRVSPVKTELYPRYPNPPRTTIPLMRPELGPLPLGILLKAARPAWTTTIKEMTDKTIHELLDTIPNRHCLQPSPTGYSVFSTLQPVFSDFKSESDKTTWMDPRVWQKPFFVGPHCPSTTCKYIIFIPGCGIKRTTLSKLYVTVAWLEQGLLTTSRLGSHRAGTKSPPN